MAKTTQTKSKTKATEAEALAPEVTGSEADLNAVRAEADALAAGEVRALTGDPFLAAFNAGEVQSVLQAHRAEVEATGVRADWKRIDALGRIAAALLYAQSRVEADPLAGGEVRALLAEARPLRRALLADARVQALRGGLPAKEVARIEAGGGAFDTTQDLVDLAALYQPALAALRGKTTVTAAELRRAAELGALLQKTLRPKGAGRAPRTTDAQRAARDLRDRVWTLLLRAHASADRAGGALWGRAVAEKLPALQARYVARRRAKAPPAKPQG